MEPDQIEPLIEAILRDNPGGLDEQALLRALRAHQDSGLDPGRPRPGLPLFRQHFLLFHTLYRLRDRLRLTRRGELRIDPMRIALEPAQPSAELGPDCSDSLLGEYDHLRAYYLDLNNLAAMGDTDVARLLAGFQAELNRRHARAEALAELELTEPVNDARIRRQYRRLAMCHHPDRGGDPQRLQAINRAARILLPRRSTPGTYSCTGP